MTTEPTPLGQILRQRRRELSLTLEDLAEQVGLTAGALSHIESGRRLPDPRNAVRIAVALGLNDEEVLEALDRAHADRRRSSAYREASAAPGDAAGRAIPARSSFSSAPHYEALPIEDLFATHSAPPSRPRQASSQAARNLARWSDDTSARIEAIDALADTAAEAIRTLRGLLEDEDETVRREARRLLRELDVRLPDE